MPWGRILGADDLETNMNVEEGDFAPAGAAHSQEWLLRRKSLNAGAGVEDSRTDLVEEGDANGDGIIEPDEDDDDGTGLSFLSDDEISTLNDSFSDLSDVGYGRGGRGMHLAAQGEYNLQDPNAKYHHSLDWLNSQPADDPTAKALRDNLNATADAEKKAIAAAEAPGGKTAENFIDLKQAEIARNLAANDIVIAEAKAKGDNAQLAKAEDERKAFLASKDDMDKIDKQLDGKTPAQQQQVLDAYAAKHPENNNDFMGDWKKFENGRLYQWEAQAGELKHVNANPGGWGASGAYNDLPGEPLKGSDSWNLSSYFSWLSFGSSSTPSAPSATNSPAAPTAPATTVTQQQPAAPAGPGR